MKIYFGKKKKDRKAPKGKLIVLSKKEKENIMETINKNTDKLDIR